MGALSGVRKNSDRLEPKPERTPPEIHLRTETENFHIRIPKCIFSQKYMKIL